MRRWFREKPKSLFSRTLLGTLTVSLTVLILVAIILFIWFRTQMVEGYHELTRITMRNTDTVFAQSVFDAKTLIMEWHSSPDGICLRLEEDVDFAEHMSFINKVRSLFRSNSYYQSVCFINDQRQVVLNIGSNVSFPVNMDGSLPEQLIQREGRTRPFVWNIESRSVDKKLLPMLTIPMAEMAITDQTFNGMTVMNIDLTQLNKSLFSDRQEDKFCIMILDGNGMVVANSNMDHLGEDWSDREWVKRVLAGEEQFECREESKRWEYLSFASALEGYYVVAQTDYVTQIVNINYNFYVIFAVIITATAVIIVMLLAVSRRIFQPFTRMIGNLKQSQIAEEMEQETDEVTFLEHFYQGVSTHMETLNEKKEKDFIVKNLLLGNQRNEIRELMQQKGILAGNRPYYMILVFVENKGQEEGLSMQEYDMLRTMVNRVFSSALEQCGHCTGFEVGLRRMLFLVSLDEKMQGGIQPRESAEKARLSVQRLAQARVYLVLSDWRQDGGEDCVRIFGRMNDCLKTRHLLGNEETMVLSEEKERGKEPSVEQILTCLKDKDKTGYLEAVKQFLAECETTPYSEVAVWLEKLALAVLKVGRVTRETNWGMKGQNFLRERILSLSDREDLYLWLESLYDEAAIQISKISNRSTAAMLEEAVDYIRNNYDDSALSVNLLADKLHISAAYFGKLFTEFTGSRTLDYIWKVRMEKAGELLLSDPDKDIAQIATEVGYNNSTYFTTAFKKHFGVTPSQFREYHTVSGLNNSRKM